IFLYFSIDFHMKDIRMTPRIQVRVLQNFVQLETVFLSEVSRWTFVKIFQMILTSIIYPSSKKHSPTLFLVRGLAFVQIDTYNLPFCPILHTLTIHLFSLLASLLSFLISSLNVSFNSYNYRDTLAMDVNVDGIKLSHF
ncbi:hypothetical protein L9F63_004801, partial [Diploptera punctata]